jgi:beta-lactamase class A
MMGLADEVQNAISAQPGVFGFYARNLGTDEVVQVDADRVLPAESAIKTCILVHYSRLVASGTVDPTLRVLLNDDLRFIGTGVLRYLANGLEPTLDDLAWLMIIVSDNTATAMLMQSIGGPAEVNTTTAALGYPTARLNEAITSVEDALAGEPFSTSSARDLAEIYTQLDERCRTMLFRQQHLIGLPRRLPHVSDAVDVGFEMPVRVFNKTGNGAGTFIDSGRFETDSAAWVVAAMASEQTDFTHRPDDVAPTLFGQLGEMLYAAWGT